jgi:tetratricopeptide (TPR) repeat protein
LAKNKSEKEAEDLFKLAFEKYQKAIDLGGKKYNFACAHALIGNKDEALRYLEQSLERRETSTDFVLGDGDWKLYILDVDFERIIKKYSSMNNK